MTTHRRPNRVDWQAGILVGALLGFVILCRVRLRSGYRRMGVAVHPMPCQ